MSKVRFGGERCIWKHFSYGLIKYNTYVAQTFGQRDKCVVSAGLVMGFQFQ